MASALFCIASPLQAICMAEAIFTFRIDSYKIYVVQHGERTKQIENFLNEKKMDYVLTPLMFSLRENIKRTFDVFRTLDISQQYDFYFHGDYRLVNHKLEHLQFVKSGGKVIYLDDGNYVMSLSNGTLKRTLFAKLRESLFTWVAEKRNISYRNFFTFYYNSIEMNGWNIIPNHLSFISNTIVTSNTNSDIFIIGTVTSKFCDFLGIETSNFKNKLSLFFNSLKNKYKNRRIVYIPHGRDNSEDIKSICEQYGIEYKKISVCVELYMIRLGNCPSTIFGFTSTALYTLHKFFPKADIFNLTIQGTSYNGNAIYKELSEFYSKVGIPHIQL